MMALVGASGSGKSTFLNILGGLDTPSAGSCVVDGNDLTRLSEAQRIKYRRFLVGHVWQQSGRNLLPELSIAANVEMPQILGGVSVSNRSRRAAELLELVGLEGMGKKKPDQLSGGEQQRAAVAVALANEPKLLLADKPTWQRYNLDLIAGVLALLGYGLSFYVSSVGNVLQGDARTLIATPISIIAPFFLVLGCLLLFFRIFPVLLQWGVRLAGRGRGAVSLLALAHVARSPRQALRMALLLALATAFTLFTFVYSATAGQHIQDIANYQTGADFSAHLLLPGSSSTLPQVISRYSTIPGVLSASAGYVGQGFGGHADLPMEIRAVDPASFGRTVVWPSQQAYSQAYPLLSELVSHRRLATTGDVVPAIVDQTTLHTLLLQVGSTFAVKVNNVSPQEMHCLIIGVVDHIPTVNSLTASVTTGGILVDYQTYLDVFTQDVKGSQFKGVPVDPPLLNQIWLGTKSDTASLEGIRAALKEPSSHLTQIVDRYLLIATLQSDPLYLILTGVLEIGTITALLLALVGDMLASWISARSRVVSFASLRAIGATSRQIALVFLWEQAIVYVTGLMLGVGFGTLLVISVLPQLTFTDVNVNLTGQRFCALQSALAT